MSATSEREREAELERLKEHLASKRSQWVPGLAPNARHKSGKGWYLGNIRGDAGDSLLIYEDTDHATHIDFNGNAFKGDDLDLIREMRGLDFPETVEYAAGLIGFELRHHGKKKNGTKAAARRIVATYDYTDADADLLFQVVRFEPKDFLQRRPNGLGGWIWNLDGVRIVPYRLPDIEAAIEHGHPVYIVEGEKDVENLRAIGFTATCNAMGAGKWRSEFAELFRGADIVIIPDNDQAGRKHAEQVAANLALVGKRVRCLELPGLPEKGDVSDWLSVGGTASKLLALADAAPEWIGAPEQPATDLGEWDAGLDDAPIEPRGWLLGNTFCRRVVSSIVAGGGIGKTAVRIAQGLSLATGRSLTGEHVFQRCRVLIVSLEDDAAELRRRVRAAMMHHNVAKEDICGWLFLATPAAMGWKFAEMKDGEVRAGDLGAKLIETIKFRVIDVVIVDPFVKSHAVEENANGAIDYVAGILAGIAAEYDCAVDVPHHISKGPADVGNADRGRGASAFKDAARLVYTLAPMSEDEAKAFGIGEAERRCLVRMDAAKVNIAPPASSAKWFRLVGVRLGNATDLYPHGDEVQTVELWQPPDTWAGLSSLALNAALTEIDQGLPDGQRFSDAGAARTLAAWRIVHKHAPDKTEQQCREIVRTWVQNGVLFTQEYQNPASRKTATGLQLNATKRPS